MESNIGSKYFDGFSFVSQELFGWIKDNDFRTIALQAPEGLKRSAVKLVNDLEGKLNIIVIILADPCFGACDISTEKLTALNLDAIVHLGHAEIPNIINPKIPIKYFELHSSIDSKAILQKKANMLAIKTEFPTHSVIGLLGSVQYISQIQKIKNALEKEDFQIYIGTGDARLKHSGQVLGCNFSAARVIADTVDGFLFIGDGLFHPLGIALATNKKVLALNPLNNKVQDITNIRDRIMRQRIGAIAAIKEHTNFGILISTKIGQNRKDYALKIKEKLSKYNRTGTLLAMDNISPAQLDYLPFEAYINTACPRLTIDDNQQYKKTIITPVELDIMLGERDWENYLFDEFV
jgi:2-(3-amino-3-carboxypropyl)histidine synthase